MSTDHSITSQPCALDVEGLSVHYGGVRAVSDVSFTLRRSGVTGLIGPNGAGKTSLVDAISGFTATASGTVTLDGHDVSGDSAHARARRGLSRTFQTGELFEDLTVRENLLVALERPSLSAAVVDLVRPRRHVPRHDDAIAWALDLVGLGGREDVLARDLSYGARKLAGVARALVTRPRVLLLDEPAAGLDDVETASLSDRIEAIAATGIAVLLIDHDMDLVLRVSDEVVVLDFGSMIAGGAPQAIRENPAVLTAYLGVSASQEEDTATRTTSVRARPAEIPDAGPEHLLDGRRLVEVSSLAAGHEGVAVLREVDLHVMEGEIVAILGANGAGKTTLLHTIAGILKPIAGSVEVLGQSVRTGATQRLAQAGFALMPDDRGLFRQLTVAENISLVNRGHGQAEESVLDSLPKLRDLWRRRVGLLSGGEQQMLSLAMALIPEPRVLAIDEMSLGLAPQVVEQLLPVIGEVSERTGMGVLLVEQHVAMALDVADRAYILGRGGVVAAGTADEVLEHRALLEASYLG